MKRVLSVFAALVVVLGVVFFQQPGLVSATKIRPTTILAPNNWSAGEEAAVDLAANPPIDGQELMGNAVKVTTTEEICHEFRGGQYHWVPEMRRLVDGKWVKVDFTASWTPDEEGKFMVCTTPSVTGIYALFAYYNGPVEHFDKIR